MDTLAHVGKPAETAGSLKRLLLGLIVLDLALIAIRVLLYDAFLAQQGSLVFIVEPVVLLLTYAGIVLATTANPSPNRLLALRQGTKVGLVTGVMWLVNLMLETFTNLSGLVGIVATAPFLLGGFLLWGIAGNWATHHTGSIGLGILAAVWSAMVCVLITVTFGFLLAYTSLPILEHILTRNPDFLRSHWTDVRAFAIANTFDSGFSHLLGALLVGMIVGTIGSLMCHASYKRWRIYISNIHRKL